MITLADIEETRATFSHSREHAPTVVVLNIEEAKKLADIIRQKEPEETFFQIFGHKCSEGFEPSTHLKRIGVVNQTTMLATETREITRVLRQALCDRYGEENIDVHFADTSDTLCYATNENQNATYALINRGADIALVVGGYNSSNTSHLVELCQEAMPTYFIKNADEILSDSTIRHFDLHLKKEVESTGWIPDKEPLEVILTCGASCPDAVVDEVLLRVLSFFPDTNSVEDVLKSYHIIDGSVA